MCGYIYNIYTYMCIYIGYQTGSCLRFTVGYFYESDVFCLLSPQDETKYRRVKIRLSPRADDNKYTYIYIYVYMLYMCVYIFTYLIIIIIYIYLSMCVYMCVYIYTYM